MIVRDWRRAKACWSRGRVVKVTEVVAVEVPDRPGGLAERAGDLRRLAGQHRVHVRLPVRRGDKAVLIFRFDQPDAAIERLQAAGIKVLSGEALESPAAG